MSDLATLFAEAQAELRRRTEPLPNAELLRLYALYKQGKLGDVQGERPGLREMVDRAKYDAWAELAGMSQAEAQQAYIDRVEALRDGD